MIRSKADRDVTVLLAEATSKADQIRGEGDAERNRIFADVFNQDQDFFAFYRSMQAYQAALDQFKLGNYSLAVAAMQGFLVTYPSSSLAPNAQYWIGMAHSGQRDYKSAIAAQRKLLTQWPASPKAPDAMLSIASAQETMGDRTSARKTLEELIAKYPGSSSATSAKQRLAASAKR